MRLKDESEALWEQFPEEYIELAEFVTALGGAESIILLVSLLYWLVDRQNGATLAAYATAGIVCIVSVKYAFGLPRPVADEAMAVERVVPLKDDPHGFPSGHAFMSVLVYGGMAYLFDRLRRPLSLACLGCLVISIALSRVVLRLHYFGDILVGGVLGIGFLLGLGALVEDDPQRGFAAGLVLAVPALLVTGPEELVFVGAGSALGGFLATTALGDIPERDSRQSALAVATVGLVFVVAVLGVAGFVSASGPVGHVVTVLTHAVLVSGILFAPFATTVPTQIRDSVQSSVG